ncbi:MAG TPA: hypothetical protein ENI33_08545 [Thermoplasmatales archaeon]|nr:hypothetical protein [Thermoplasmatales archaeon]
MKSVDSQCSRFSGGEKRNRKLDEKTKTRIKTALKKIAIGIKTDVKKLKGIKEREDLYRLRVGDYRIIYYEDAKCIKIIQIIPGSKNFSFPDSSCTLFTLFNSVTKNFFSLPSL